MVEAQATPPGSGGNAKYVALGLLLLAGAYGFWFFMQQPPPAPPPEPVEEPKVVERINPHAEPEFVLEEEEPEPEPVKPKATKTRIRYIPGTWECSGDIDRAKAARILAANKRQVTTCYERRLKLNNVLQGTLKLTLKVGPTGSVVATNIGGTLNDNEVYNCVRNLAQKWSFPAPEGGNCAVVAAPFNFTPRKD